MVLFKKNKDSFKSSIFNAEFKQTLFKAVSVEFLRGLVNIDGGYLGIATDWFISCDECNKSYYKTTCDRCGRNANNYVHFRSGRGDGVYPVLTLSDEKKEKSLGFLILFDLPQLGTSSIGQIYSGMMQELQKFQDNNDLVEAFNELAGSWDLIVQNYSQDLQMFEIAELELNKSEKVESLEGITSLFVVGESGEGLDSDSALINVLDAEEGLYKVFLVGSRDLNNNNAFIPNLALVLETKLSQKIGLDSEIIPKLNLDEEQQLWGNSNVASYMGNPQSIVAMSSNYVYFNALRIIAENFGDDVEIQKAFAIGAVSWLSMLNVQQPNDDIENIVESFIKNYEINVNVINELRGQFNRKII